MPECNYCEESFADEEAYLDHLHEAHDEGELSRIDERRVDGHVGEEGDGFPTGPVIIAGLLLFTLGVLIYVTFFVWGGNSGAATSGVGDVAQTPTNVGSVHEHGTINVTINGQTFDFSKQRFKNPRQFPAFHFEPGSTAWHVHAEGVTLEYAMSTLGIDVTQTSVTYQGTTYRDSDPGTSVTVEVDDESVDPTTYVLDGVSANDGQGGDHIRIVVTTENGTAN